MRPCISIWGSVRPSVRLLVHPSVCRSVGRWRFRKKQGKIIIFEQIIVGHVITSSYNHHEDASLALWALFWLRCKFLSWHYDQICPFFSKINFFFIPHVISDQNHLFFLSLKKIVHVFTTFLHNNHCVIKYRTFVGIQKMFCISCVGFFQFLDIQK